MSMVKDLPENEKPQEKALLYGIRTLSNTELMAVLLRSGTKQRSVLEISAGLLQKSGGISGISHMSIKELCAIEGIGEVKALQLHACFELVRRIKRDQAMEAESITSPEIVSKWLEREIGDSMQENFLVLYLDNQFRILRYKLLFVGTINTSAVFPREVFKEALLLNSTDLILVHNHPSGNLTPSRQDKILTGRMMKVGKTMGVNVLDHIIVSSTDSFSFSMAGILEECLSAAQKEC